MSNTISNKALKLKLNPNSSQYSFFLKFFGCERFVYNFYLNEKNQFYEKEIKPLGNDKKAGLFLLKERVQELNIAKAMYQLYENYKENHD